MHVVIRKNAEVCYDKMIKSRKPLQPFSVFILLLIQVKEVMRKDFCKAYAIKWKYEFCSRAGWCGTTAIGMSDGEIESKEK